ncbi:tyrosine-type recombinase/integrase [Actinobaculum massiliense]|uniref:tyrosine-type recombinase/integrase n=1 Tax=Actinobaculum massiliense TaxID=202789 RepID=UPI00071AF7DA|nr:site-specific integrase [Actinobaculum massiliense]
MGVYGTGSIYQRSDNGLWVGVVEAGWTEKGKRRRISVAAKTRRLAAQKLRALQHEIAKNGIPTEGTSRTITIKEFATAWLDRRKNNVTPSTYTADSGAITRWIIPAIGTVQLARLSPSTIRKVYDAIYNAGRKTATARRTHAVLMLMLKDALADGHTIPPAALHTAPPAKGTSQREAIPAADALAILRAGRERPEFSRWLAAFYLGLRPAEALGLTWDCVDLEAGVAVIEWQLKTLRYNTPRDPASGFRIPRDFEARHLTGTWNLVRPKTKAGRRTIPLVGPLAQELALWRTSGPASPYGLVWPEADGSPGRDKKDRARWRELCESAGAVKENGAPYDLYEARHTTASLLRAAGVSDDVITAIMGHSSIMSSAAYIHIDLAQTRAALEKATTQLRKRVS